MRHEPRFNDYREITAKYEGKSTACGSRVGGHDIAVGDQIGWIGPSFSGRSINRGTMCASCWLAWCSENAEAEACEDQCESMGMELGREEGESW